MFGKLGSGTVITFTGYQLKYRGFITCNFPLSSTLQVQFRKRINFTFQRTYTFICNVFTAEIVTEKSGFTDLFPTKLPKWTTHTANVYPSAYSWRGSSEPTTKTEQSLTISAGVGTPLSANQILGLNISEPLTTNWTDPDTQQFLCDQERARSKGTPPTRKTITENRNSFAPCTFC